MAAVRLFYFQSSTLVLTRYLFTRDFHCRFNRAASSSCGVVSYENDVVYSQELVVFLAEFQNFKEFFFGLPPYSFSLFSCLLFRILYEVSSAAVHLYPQQHSKSPVGLSLIQRIQERNETNYPNSNPAVGEPSRQPRVSRIRPPRPRPRRDRCEPRGNTLR